MKKETAKRILEIYERIDKIKESIKFEQTNYDCAKFINSEYLMLRSLNKLAASNRAINRFYQLIDRLSVRLYVSSSYLNTKRLELEMELDQHNLSINKEMQLKAKLELINEML